jgi:hypothetical protein
MTINKVIFTIFCLTPLFILNGCSVAASQLIYKKPISEKNDNIIHTTVYHNDAKQSLRFLVTFDIGYFDLNGQCIMHKRRVFKAEHGDGDRALTLGHHLANEYGPGLFNCVRENLHVIGSQYPDQAMTYRLKHNGLYYTGAIPAKHEVYPR